MTFARKWSVRFTAVLLVGLLGACGGDSDSTDTATEPPGDATTTVAGAAPGAASGNAVSVNNTAFSPATLSVKVGEKVTWTFSDSIPHHVLADDKSFDSGEKTSGTYDHTFTSAGSFSYICKIHPFMKGTITVG